MSVIVSGTLDIPFQSIVGPGGIDLQFRGEHTIFEHQIVCTMTPLDFNFSINPTSEVSASSGETIRDLMLSGSLTPYMSTVGLYNEYDQLVVVAKFSKPIKRLLDTDQTVIIRFDV